jgi:hypothetical protein
MLEKFLILNDFIKSAAKPDSHLEEDGDNSYGTESSGNES